MLQLDECNGTSLHRILNGTITINIIIITAFAVINFCFFLLYNQQAKYLQRLFSGQSISLHAPDKPIRLQAEFSASKSVVTKP
jgi:hypothetical protein